MGYRKSRSPQAEWWGRAIRHLRRNRVHLTQAGLAEEIQRLSKDIVSCTQSTVAHWERGDFEPSITSQPWIAKALDTDVDVLFSEPGSRAA